MMSLWLSAPEPRVFSLGRISSFMFFLGQIPGRVLSVPVLLSWSEMFSTKSQRTQARIPFTFQLTIRVGCTYVTPTTSDIAAFRAAAGDIDPAYVRNDDCRSIVVLFRPVTETVHQDFRICLTGSTKISCRGGKRYAGIRTGRP